MTTVLVVDDQALVRSGFRIILEQQADLEVVGEAATGVEAIRLTAELDPDVVLMDIRMPELDGLAATRRIVQRHPRSRVLVLTTYDLDDYVVDALRAGASGYLLKDVRPEALLAAVRATAAGETALGQAVVGRLVEEFLRASRPDPSVQARLDRLSDRERDVLAAVARGLTNPEIAAELVLSPATVKTHVANLLAKLELRDRVQAVILAYESGFVRRI